ncbi:MAG: protein kinase [Myxococcales bacterium]|nr:protein kinase [Myxococcales bacterium]
MSDAQLQRFARGELSGEELEAFERRLDADEGLRAALAKLLSTHNAPTVASAGPVGRVELDNALTFGRELGRGGMATVTLATQGGLERDVAVKRALRDEAHDDALLIQEARLQGVLEHPAIVPVHFIATDEAGRPMVVFKRVEGEPWSGLLRHPEAVEARFGQPALEWHLRVLLTVCDALAFAHARGVIHRDVKPANVMVGSFGEVYLTDWGLGGLLRADAQRGLPCVHDTVGGGTLAYMAPEQLQEARLSEATDLWLVGACLYEVLYGRAPFLGRSRAERVGGLYACSFPPGPRADLVAVAERALAVDPAARFGSMLALKQALEACLRHTDSDRLVRRAGALWRTATAQRERTRADAWVTAGAAAHTLRAALELWPENGAARAFETVLIEGRVGWALEEGQPDVAEALLREHPGPPAGLAGRVRAAVEEAAVMQARARGLDPDIGQRQRVTFLLGVVVMMVVFNSARLVWPALYASRWSLTVSSIAFLVGFGAWSWSHRALLRSSTLNRQLSALVLTTTLAQISTRTTAAMMGWSRAQALTVDLSVVALTMSIGAAVFHSSFVAGAVVCFVGQGLALAFPAAAEPLFGVTSITAVSAVAVGLRSWRRRRVTPARQGGD